MFSLVFLVIVSAGMLATMTRSTWVERLCAGACPVSNFRAMIGEQKNRLIAMGPVLACAVLFWPSSKMGGYKNPLDRLFDLCEIKTKKGYHPVD